MAAITPAKRSLVKFLKVDPETFPLLTVLSMTTFGLGYWSAQKLNWFNDDENVRVAQEPWAKDTPSNAAYKYKYYEHGNPKGKLMVRKCAICCITGKSNTNHSYYRMHPMPWLNSIQESRYPRVKFQNKCWHSPN